MHHHLNKRERIPNEISVEIRKHHEDLCTFAAKCRDKLMQDPAKGIWSPVLGPFHSDDAKPRGYSYVRGDLFWNVKDDLSVMVSFDWEYEVLFNCLRSHLSNNRTLWSAFEELKNLASEQIKNIAEKSAEFPDGAWVSSPPRRLSELVNIICKELEIVTLKRRVSGKCKACPED